MTLDGKCSDLVDLKTHAPLRVEQKTVLSHPDLHSFLTLGQNQYYLVGLGQRWIICCILTEDFPSGFM